MARAVAVQFPSGRRASFQSTLDLRVSVGGILTAEGHAVSRFTGLN